MNNIDQHIPDGLKVILTSPKIALRTTQWADKIFVLAHGGVVEQGTHDERCEMNNQIKMTSRNA